MTEEELSAELAVALHRIVVRIKVAMTGLKNETNNDPSADLYEVRRIAELALEKYYENE